MKIVSACLAGINCRLDGTARPCQKIINLVTQGEAMPVCPEQLGGLSTPRPPTEQIGNKVVTKEGKDVTAAFKRGAQETLKLAKLINCEEAILKSKSPSCGCGQIYDGTFSGKLIEGDGILTALLKKNGISVKTEEDI